MKPPGYTTKELTAETLPDFERFFEGRPAPGAFSCWCLYHHAPRGRTSASNLKSKTGLAAWNRRKMRELVDSGRSHGILVYSDDEPVGWCQFGSWEELPRFGAESREPAREGAGRLWRITCFTIDRSHRRRGVARNALRAALEAIDRRGGGLVEAYPVTRRGAYREYLGTVSMFRKEGFTVVARFGASNVVTRKII